MWTLPRICWDSKFKFGNTSPQGIRSLFIDGCAHLWLSHCSYCHLFCHVVMFLAIWVPLSTTTITGDLFLLCCENKLEPHVKFCSKVTFWQNWKIAKMALLNPCMKFQFFLPKDFFWGIMKEPFTRSIHNFFQPLSNPGFRYVIVQTETFLKKDSRDFKNSFLFRFLWIPSKTGEQN